MRSIGISGVLTLAVSATVLAGILALLFYVSQTTTSLAEAMAEQSMRQLVDAASDSLDLRAAQATELAAALARRPGIRDAFEGNPAIAGTVLNETLGSYKDIFSILVLDASGTAAEEQSATVEEISLSVAAINQIASETADAMLQSATAVTELADQAQGLSGLVADIRGNGRAALTA
jgi:methyl-accepting chemotaxis protein